MKKRIFKWFIFSIIILLIFIFGVLSFSRIKEKRTTKESIQIFHEFCAFNVGDNQKFCTKSLPNQPILLLFMNPECDFCQEEIKQIKERQNVLSNVSILLISITQKKQAADFYFNYRLNQLNNMRLLIDEDVSISKFFGIKTIPTIFIYDKNKKLIFNHKGEIKVEAFFHFFAEQ